jgi:sulfite reductase (NADPH) hemoprotein beta-component
MYRYDEFDEVMVRERISQFSDQVHRRLAGEITEDQFKLIRLMNGLYLQLHAYMLRIAIPYGTLSSRKLHQLAMIARKYDRGYAHFTTRQNLQMHWFKLVDVPAALSDLADVEMHTIQTSGNTIRNVTSDQWAGAVPGEVDDPRVWCEIIRQYSTFHPEFGFLPRKFKISVVATEHDRAAIQANDIGLHLKRVNGELAFDVYVGGGQGRTPYIGPLIGRDIPAADILSYLESCVRVYNRYGRRDNSFKARIKILVSALGASEYRRQVEAEWDEVRDGVLKLPQAEIDRIRAYFKPPSFKPFAGESAAFAQARAHDKAFDRWARINLAPHKAPGYSIVIVSLKKIGAVPGDCSSDQMDVIADLALKYSFDEVRVAHEQNLVLPHVAQDDLYTVWKALDAAGLATPNSELISDIIACPGLDYCDLANARAIPVAQEIAKRFADLEEQEKIGKFYINISGCINACGHHHVGNIGIVGVDKHGEEFYQILLGGRADEQARLAKIAGKGMSGEEVPAAVERVVKKYLEVRAGPDEQFIATYERLGAAPFQEALYGA